MIHVFGVSTDRAPGEKDTRLPALEELYDKYAGALYRHCGRMLGDTADAEDALQETFFNAYRGLPSFRNTAGYTAWLYRIATNVCLTFLRRRHRKDKRLAELSGRETALAEDPDDVVAARQILEELVGVISERELEIVSLHYIAGMDQGQVAASLGISRRAVAKRLRKLRDRLDRLRR